MSWQIKWNKDCIVNERYVPIHEDLLLERSIMARLLGLLRRERLASEMSAVTRVIVILKQNKLLLRS